jgi:DNA-binding NarL/FixJ family response regulator
MTASAQAQDRSRAVTVAIVEDDARVRRSLIAILRHAPDCECVGEYGSGEEAVAGLVRKPAQVVVVDVNLPGINGVECVRQLAALLSQAQMLMLTVHEDSDTIFEALAAGASGYLLKPVRAQELIEAVLNVSRGGAPMSSSIARKVVQAFRGKPAVEAADTVLSSRETEVLDHLAMGHSYKEISERLQISYGTVHTYIERIYKKLHVRSRAQAVAVHMRK